MRAALRRRLGGRPGEAGLTLVEMLVAATMSVILVGASTAMLISAVRDEPALSRKAQNVTTARWQLERVVREIRNGVEVVGEPTASQVSFLARVSRTSCGGAPSAQGQGAIECRVTYRCEAEQKRCLRWEETTDGTPVGSSTVALSGIGDAAVFCFVPSTETDPSRCGAPATATPSYVGVTLRVPNPSGSGLLTISDGATLRTAALKAG
ncbi:MAG TPA: hypothetical protein VHA54_03550 [Solirubrobacterales bacterium]|nr:hypothetical protein [Solirubrobacterales bacterium]